MPSEQACASVAVSGHRYVLLFCAVSYCSVLYYVIYFMLYDFMLFNIV